MEFLHAKEWWQIILMVLFASLSIGGLIVIATAAIRKNGLNLSFGKAHVSGSGEKDRLAESNGAHKNCPRWREILVVVQIETEKVTRINHIREIEMIRDQMNYAEEKVSELRKEMRSAFLSLLRETTGEQNVVHTHASGDYANVLRVLTYELLDKFRVIYRENHLSEMSDVDFEGYLKVRMTNVRNMITEILDEVYPPYSEPSREQVYEVNHSIMVRLDDIVEDAIRRGRIMAKAREEEIALIETKARDEVEKILGG